MLLPDLGSPTLMTGSVNDVLYGCRAASDEARRATATLRIVSGSSSLFNHVLYWYRGTWHTRVGGVDMSGW